ncbi:MAG: carbonic anhydrase [Nitrospirae bacterium]|nr:carbonic anhydrase [Nitrospirota bacterium]MBI3377916.1 carbonic anhydrase [Nitrospirota bacterium]
MKKLYKGIHKFQGSYFKKGKVFFKRLSKRQEPEVLFITCSDSRIDPNLVTQSKPGEIFIVRNVGNIIPPYDAIKDKNSVAAAIEFAVLSLKVKDIIVCGHSNCGAMEALYKDERELTNMPHLKDWLKLADSVRNIVLKHYPETSAEIRQRITEEENVLCQLHNIQTYPCVREALDSGALHLHGWNYNIETGKIYAYDTDADMFKEVGLSKTPDNGFKGAE